MQQTCPNAQQISGGSCDWRRVDQIGGTIEFANTVHVQRELSMTECTICVAMNSLNAVKQRWCQMLAMSAGIACRNGDGVKGTAEEESSFGISEIQPNNQCAQEI